MEKTLRPLTKLPYKMGKVADVVNNIIDHIKNGGGGGGVNFTPGKPLELTKEKVLQLDKNYVLSPLKADEDGHILIDKTQMKTINNQSIFGQGNIKVGTGHNEYIAPTGIGTTIRLLQKMHISDPSTLITSETSFDGETIDNTKFGYESEPTENIISWIRANSHAYVGKLELNAETGRHEMYLRQLNDTDYNKFVDGTDASAYISDVANEGWDVFLKLPKFWYFCEEDDKGLLMRFRDTEHPDYHVWDENQLIGVYEAYVENNNCRSISGKASIGNITQPNFKTYSRNRNNNKTLVDDGGYRLVTFEMHSIMAWLFYGYYGNANCQAVCGSGTNDYNKGTGTCDTMGIAEDTNSTNGNQGSIKFWGLENWWGNKSEWIDNLQTIDGAGKTKIMNFDGTTRLEETFHNTGGNCITAYKWTSEGLLVVDTTTNDGTFYTYYCDGFWLGGSGYVGYRSGISAHPYGGVGFLRLDNGPSSAYPAFGSRLAYCGEFHID